MKFLGRTPLTSLDKPTTLLLPITAESTYGEVSSFIEDLNGKLHSNQWERISKEKGSSIEIILESTGNNLDIIQTGSQEVRKLSILKFTAAHKKNFHPRIHIVSRFIDGSQVEKLSKGIGLGLHQVSLYKTDQSESQEYELSIEESHLQNEARTGLEVSSTINSIIDLVNTPSNIKSPDHMVDWVKKSGSTYGYQVEIKNKETLKKEAFGAILAVNRGSEHGAYLAISTYTPEHVNPDFPTIILVGKGVTFDTGGLSIKGSRNMHYMKSDMGGAAAVFGTMEACAKLKIPFKVTGITPITDNSVDALAIKPGDVIKSYSGKTIEVIDTDAEGRLILADALSYAVKNFKSDYLIDLATLTGSAVRALGTETSAMMGHNDEFISALYSAGEEAEERVWRLPLWPAYNDYLQSDIADIRNLGNKPMAGAITAAKFLETFTEKHPAWIHLDIAATAYGGYPISKGYSGTGYGIDLLIKWMKNLEQSLS